MTTKDKFAVVEFVDEEAIEVVPLSWVNDRDHTCPFPEGPKAGSLRRNSRSSPLTSWPSYRIKVRCVKDSFKKANSYADKFQFTSAVESSDASADESQLQRRKRPRILFSPSVSPKRTKKKFEAPNVQQEASIAPNVTPTSLKSIYLSSSLRQEEEGSGSIHSDRAPASSIDSNDSDDGVPPATCVSFTTPSRPASKVVSSNRSTSSDLDSIGGESSLTFQTLAKRIFSQLHDIKEDLAIIKSNTFKSTGKITECPLTIPITTEEAIQASEDRLDAKDIQRAFEKWAVQLGGQDYKSHCRRVLKSLVCHSLSRRMNFSGRNQKLGFQKLKLCSTLISAIVQAHDIDRSSVEKVIQDWFRNSGDHQGGRDKRRNKNQL